MTLRVGIMCGGTTLRAWHKTAIEELLRVPGTQLALIIVDATPGLDTAARWRRRIQLHDFGYRAFRKAFVRPTEDRPVDASPLFEGVPHLACEVDQVGRFSQFFKPKDVEEIRRYQLDIILRFAFGIIRGEILQAATYGVWSFHHDDERLYRGGPPALWEIYHGDDVTGAILQRLTERLDGGVVLKRGHIRTSKHSYGANLDAIFRETSHWPAEVARRIVAGAGGEVKAEPSRTSAPVYRAPSNLQTIRLAATVAAASLLRARSLVLHDHWSIGVVDAPIHRFLDHGFQPEIRHVEHPARTRFVADPFGYVVDDRLIVLCEDYDHVTGHGKLAKIDLATGETTPIANLAGHASYPFLLEHRGKRWCVPETSAAWEVAIYEVEDDGSLVRRSTLLSGIPASDPTLFQHDGRWWLAFCDKRRDPTTNLYLYHAPELDGPFEPHARNPVKTDVRSARPAGTPFVHAGQLYRPAQDCSITYGGRVVLNRVDRLTPMAFDETPVASVGPFLGTPFADGVHTLAAVGARTLLDGKRRRTQRHETSRALRRLGP